MNTEIRTADRMSGLMAASPLFFGRVVAPTYFNKKPAKFHQLMIDEILNLPKEIRIVVLEVPRGFAKTMIVSTILPLWKGILKGLGYAVIGSYSDTKSKQILDDVKNIVSCDSFKQNFGDMRGEKWSEHTVNILNDAGNSIFPYPVDMQFMSRGRGSQIAGMRYKQHRIDLFIGDDLENPEEAYNQEIVDRNERWILEVVMPALEDNGRIILIGTPFAWDCTTRRFVGKRGVKLIQFPALADEDLAKKLGIKEDCSIWEDRWSTEWIRSEREKHRENGTLDIFERQYMLNPYPPGGVGFEKPKVYVEADLKDKLLNKYITVDLAYKRKKTSDRTGIIVASWDTEDKCYIREAIDGRWGDLASLEKVVEIAKRNLDAKCIGVESYAYGIVEETLRKLMRQAGITLHLEELEPQNRAKIDRIRNMTKYTNQGKLFIKEDQKRFKNQLDQFHGQEMKEDGLLDAWAYQEDVKRTPVDHTVTDEEKKQKMWDKFYKTLSVVADNSDLDGNYHKPMANRQARRVKVGYNEDALY